MARTAPMNPRYHSGPVLELKTIRAKNAEQWEANAPGTYDTGLANPLITDGTDVKFLFAKKQSTATSSTDVLVWNVPGASTKFVGFVSNDANDTTADIADRGASYGIHVAANTSSEEVATVNVNEGSNVSVVVDELIWDVESEKHASTDSPGQVIFHFISASLD